MTVNFSKPAFPDGHYLTNTRLMRAKFKLQTSNESTMSIAESAGYASEAAFSKAIKKHFNKTPGELRKEPLRVFNPGSVRASLQFP